MTDSHDHPYPGQKIRTVDFGTAGYNKYPEPSTLEEGNLATSEVDGTRKHKVILDIDFPAKLVPSSTPGHFHLYLDRELDWEEYRHLLNVLSDVGIIEPGYANASIDRGYTAVRLPWIKKEKRILSEAQASNLQT